MIRVSESVEFEIKLSTPTLVAILVAILMGTELCTYNDVSLLVKDSTSSKYLVGSPFVLRAFNFAEIDSGVSVLAQFCLTASTI